MKIVNLGESNSVLNRFVSELRDVNIQKDSLRFRRNIERIGEIMAYEISKDFAYSRKEIQTPLGIAPMNTPDDRIVISTILSSGLFELSRLCRKRLCLCLPQIQRPLEFRYPHRIYSLSKTDRKNFDHYRSDACNRKFDGTRLRSVTDQRSSVSHPRSLHHRQQTGYRIPATKNAGRQDNTLDRRSRR